MMRVLDLFAGACGGWSLGMHRAGYRTVAACEIDPWRRAIFFANNPGTVMYDDVRTVTAARLLDDLGYLPDIIVGSPPCQDASAANTRGRGVDGERTGLVFEFIRIVGEVRPAWTALENSPRLRTRGYDRVAEGLEALGYAVWPLVVGLDDAGANHRRKRVWIVAADAERDGVREQSGRGRGPRGACTAVVGRDDADAQKVGRARPVGQPPQGAHQRPGSSRHPISDDPHADCQGQHGRPLNGEVARGVDGIAADAGRRFRAGGTVGAEGLDGWLACPGSNEKERHLGGSSPDPHGARYALRSSLAGDDGAQLPPALRDIGRAWPRWNGGIAGLAASCVASGFGNLDDGLSPGLAPNARNRCIAAYGDAIGPQISEMIGRAMLSAMEGLS